MVAILYQLHLAHGEPFDAAEDLDRKQRKVTQRAVEQHNVAGALLDHETKAVGMAIGVVRGVTVFRPCLILCLFDLLYSVAAKVDSDVLLLALNRDGRFACFTRLSNNRFRLPRTCPKPQSDGQAVDGETSGD